MNSVAKSNTFLYSPESPEKLIKMVNKKYTEIDRLMIDTHDIMPDLNNLINPYAKLPKIKYFTGVEGIISILEDVLIEEKEFY
jgi:hypothetical protein